MLIKLICPVYRASLDRIVVGGDYSKENIRFVSIRANIARWDGTDAELLFLSKAIVRHLSGLIK